MRAPFLSWQEERPHQQEEHSNKKGQTFSITPTRAHTATLARNEEHCIATDWASSAPNTRARTTQPTASNTNPCLDMKVHKNEGLFGAIARRAQRLHDCRAFRLVQTRVDSCTRIVPHTTAPGTSRLYAADERKYGVRAQCAWCARLACAVLISWLSYKGTKVSQPAYDTCKHEESITYHHGGCTVPSVGAREPNSALASKIVQPSACPC